MLGLLIGLFIGSFVGIFFASLCTIASKSGESSPSVIKKAEVDKKGGSIDEQRK